MTTTLTATEIRLIHSCVCRYFDQRPLVKSIGTVDMIADRPDTELFGIQPYDTVFLKAASLVEGILRLHPFVDGNKRTALMTATVYLHRNGYDLNVSESDIGLIASVAGNENTDSESVDKLVRRVSRWLTESSTRDKA